MDEKQTEAVKAALQAVEAQAERIKAQHIMIRDAQAELQKMEAAKQELLKAVTQACTEADASLPKCSLVRRHRYGGSERPPETMVILRQTPSGQIVIRPIGSVKDESRWKMARWGQWYPVSSEHGYSSMTRELRDVPVEFVERAKAVAK